MKHVIEFATEKPTSFRYELAYLESDVDPTRFRLQCQFGGRLVRLTPLMSVLEVGTGVDACVTRMDIGTDMVLAGFAGTDDDAPRLHLSELGALELWHEFGPGQILRLTVTCKAKRIPCLLQFAPKTEASF